VRSSAFLNTLQVFGLGRKLAIHELPFTDLSHDLIHGAPSVVRDGSP
jgi:hypothetical protein